MDKFFLIIWLAGGAPVIVPEPYYTELECSVAGDIWSPQDKRYSCIPAPNLTIMQRGLDPGIYKDLGSTITTPYKFKKYTPNDVQACTNGGDFPCLRLDGK